ncbi:hypothetical protein FNV43_RR20106 [Rhamnella rubrinervis]|uniref:Uncharacterized protein n=1 Tax=Rhamnella rubrinervis TaxID=2594499 RepID=A0A8K0GUA2_9ROSA|nr:hypothetical protein FNV43_RR20106 [Rhamnella rubrinervis]
MRCRIPLCGSLPAQPQIQRANFQKSSFWALRPEAVPEFLSIIFLLDHFLPWIRNNGGGRDLPSGVPASAVREVDVCGAVELRTW